MQVADGNKVLMAVNQMVGTSKYVHFERTHKDRFNHKAGERTDLNGFWPKGAPDLYLIPISGVPSCEGDNGQSTWPRAGYSEGDKGNHAG